MRISKISMAASTVVVALLATACAGEGADKSDGPVEYETDGTFTFAMTGDPGAVNPYTNYQVLSEMSFLAYDSLVYKTPDGEFVSGLAKDWEVGSDLATFTLNEGVTCSDGHELTATDVGDALEYLGDPANGSVLYGSLVPSVPYTVTADDEAGTVEVALDEPFPFLAETIARVPILCPAALEEQDRLDRESIGTGPFTLTEAVPGDHYTFTRRDDYAWGPDGATTEAEGLAKTVTIRVVPNETTAANLLLSGEVNMAFVSGADSQRLDAQGLSSLDARVTNGELWFNQREGRPGSDEAVRRALVAALDLDELASVSTAGEGDRATGMVANVDYPCREDTVEGHLPAFDADDAAAVLEEAGWALDDGVWAKDGEPLEVNLHFTTETEGGVASSELIAERWKELGVDVEISSDSPNASNSVMFESGDFDAYWVGFNLTLPHQIVPFVTGEAPPNGTNFAAIENADYAQLTGDAIRTVGDESCELWNQAEHSLFDRVDVVPVSESVRSYFLSGAEAETDGRLQLPIPTSIRVVK